GAVTVTTPAQDATGNVAATLAYVDASGKLLSKEARAGTTTIAVGKAVKQTVDTRFYPQVQVCLTNLDSNGFVTPGTTEVQLCDGSGHPIQSGSGYKVAAPALSTSGCPADGGGVCPSDAAGVKADFTSLTGDDIRALVGDPVRFRVHDVYADQDMTSTFTNGAIAFYGELKTHWPAANLGATKDLFHTLDAQKYCGAAVRNRPGSGNYLSTAAAAAEAIQKGVPSGGATNDAEMATLYTGGIASAIHTGGDTNPEIFVDGTTEVRYSDDGVTIMNEVFRDKETDAFIWGTLLPSALVFVNGSRGASAMYSNAKEGVQMDYGIHHLLTLFMGYYLIPTGWNLSDAYYVNNWPGTPYTDHKGNGDANYPYVTQVNYITGYICAASLH
ncbi:hypothetical protein Q1E02_004790, partial [Salmonella enterica]|nr:hypothetical protein [Salmonella enterica]